MNLSEEIFKNLKMPSSQILQELVLRDLSFAAKTRSVKTADGRFYSSLELAQSSTWSFNAIEKNFEDVNEACERLSALFGKRVQCNAYFTPKGGQGLPIHYDLHDIVIFQIEGSKNWNVWPAFRKNVSLQTLLEDEDENIKNWTFNQTPRELILKQKSILYLSKGEPHVAHTTCEDSLHLSFGIYHE